MATVKKGIECFKINGRPDLQKLFDNHPEKGKKSDFEIAREIILGEEKVLHDRLNTVKEKLKLPTKPYTQPEFPQQKIDEINKIADDERNKINEPLKTEENEKGQQESTGQQESKSTPSSTRQPNQESEENLNQRYQRVTNDNDLVDPYDRAVKYFADGGKINPSELERIFGSKADKGARISLMKNNAGTVKQIAHFLWETDDSKKYEDTHYIDAVEGALRNNASKSAMQKDIVDRYDYEAAREKYLDQTDGQEAVDIVDNMTEEDIDILLKLDAEENSEQKVSDYIDGLTKKNEDTQSGNKPNEPVETKKEPPPKATVDETGETATGETEVLDEAGGEPPKPPSKKEAVEDGDDLTKRFKQWTVIDKDKTITQDVKDTHELREGAELLNEDYQRLQRDKAATDLSMDLLIQDARAQLGDKYLDFVLNLVENGNLELETRNAIMQSLLWRQGLSPDIVNNLKAIDKKLATRSQDNFMIRRSLATEDEISDEQNDMIESAFGDEGAEIKKAKEVLNEFFSDNTVDEKVQMSAEGKTIEELNEEIADLQKQLQEAKETPKAGKVDSKKFKAKAEMAANNIKNKEGNGWFSKIIDEINEIAKKC